jgi:NAD(P)-dependent dehydrogenase (short-subunit alcohol dehydrogenase family)
VRVLVTGAASGIGRAVTARLEADGARVLAVDLAPDSEGPGEPFEADLTTREGNRAAVDRALESFGGLDVVVANAGIAAQLPLVGGNPEVMERTIAVNVMGVYNTLRAAGPHISHPNGYALPVSSLAAALHLPMLGAYSASKAAVEALGNTLRSELRGSGAKVGVAYFAELDTDMTSRGFSTEAASKVAAIKLTRVAPLRVGIDALERGIARRARRVVAPRWVGPLLRVRMLAQPVVDRAAQKGLKGALETARAEDAPLTTPQPR